MSDARARRALFAIVRKLSDIAHCLENVDDTRRLRDATQIIAEVAIGREADFKAEADARRSGG